MSKKNASATPTPLLKSLGVIVFGAFGLAGLFLIYTLTVTVLSTERARTWPSVAGTLVFEDLKVHPHRNFSGLQSGPQRQLRAAYTYEVDGKAYTGTRVSFGMQGSNNFTEDPIIRQRELLDRIPLMVFYDPQRPQESVIDRTLPAEESLFMIAFLFFPCGISVYLMITALLYPCKAGRRLAPGVYGVLQGGLALGFMIFYQDLYGWGGNLLLAILSIPFFAGAYQLFRRFRAGPVVL